MNNHHDNLNDHWTQRNYAYLNKIVAALKKEEEKYKCCCAMWTVFATRHGWHITAKSAPKCWVIGRWSLPPTPWGPRDRIDMTSGLSAQMFAYRILWAMCFPDSMGGHDQIVHHILHLTMHLHIPWNALLGDKENKSNDNESILCEYICLDLQHFSFMFEYVHLDVGSNISASNSSLFKNFPRRSKDTLAYRKDFAISIKIGQFLLH